LAGETGVVTTLHRLSANLGCRALRFARIATVSRGRRDFGWRSLVPEASFCTFGQVGQLPKAFFSGDLPPTEYTKHGPLSCPSRERATFALFFLVVGNSIRWPLGRWCCRPIGYLCRGRRGYDSSIHPRTSINHNQHSTSRNAAKGVSSTVSVQKLFSNVI